jgi:hypothetical protein
MWKNITQLKLISGYCHEKQQKKLIGEIGAELYQSSPNNLEVIKISTKPTRKFVKKNHQIKCGIHLRIFQFHHIRSTSRTTHEERDAKEDHGAINYN